MDNKYVTLSYNLYVVLLHIELQMLHKKGGLPILWNIVFRLSSVIALFDYITIDK